MHILAFLFLAISGFILLVPFLVYFTNIGINLVPFEVYLNILKKDDFTLNSIYLIFLFFFFSTIYFSILNKSVNTKIRSLVNFNEEGYQFHAVKLSSYIYLLILFYSAIFFLFFDHTAFEWSTSGEITSIIRLTDISFISNDFYTNSIEDSPKIIFSYFIYLFSYFGLGWYGILYFIKWLSALSVPPLLFIFYIKVLRYWNPEGSTPNFNKKIYALIFLGVLGPFCILQLIPRMDPFGWGAIQYFTAADPMRISFIAGLLYLILHFLEKPFIFLKILLLSLSTFMHPAVGVCNYFISISLILSKEISKNKLFEFGLLFSISIFIPSLLLFIFFDGGNYLTPQEFFEIYILSRHPHHYLISEIFDIHSVFWIILMLLPIKISFLLRNKQLITLSIVSFLLMFLAVLFQFLFSEILPLKPIMKIGPGRFTSYLSLIWTINSLIIFSYLYRSEYQNIIKNNFIYDLFKLISKKSNNLLYKLERLLIGKKIFLSLTSIFVISTFLLSYESPIDRNKDGSTVETIYWIKDNTALNSVVFTPVLDPALIRVYSERSIFADWMFPFSEKHMKEFSRRYDFFINSKNYSLKDYSCLQPKEIDFLVLENKGKNIEYADFVTKKWLVFDLSKLTCFQ